MNVRELDKKIIMKMKSIKCLNGCCFVFSSSLVIDVYKSDFSECLLFKSVPDNGVFLSSLIVVDIFFGFIAIFVISCINFQYRQFF